ncbi:MAG: hypothetical protein B9S38_02355 [Verrucomicrobiia bacterium Tous-C4TDCM]|nr:MAG: hypothetical protein B9S38_02355 [Verrucomicrobiae bacterium Tous-C4TDCM]
MTTQAQPWHEILAELRGRRLAIYDDMMRYGAHAIDWEAISVAHSDDVDWLWRHRFIERDEGPPWRARPALEAKRIFEQVGPENTGRRPLPRHTAPTPAEPVRYQVPIQSHQAEMFALEGYRG